MHKSFLFFLVATFYLTVLSGQRMDELRATHNFIQLPYNPLQGEFKTYDVVIDYGGVNLSKMGMLESSMAESYFALPPYELEPGRGDFLIVVRLDDDFYVSKEAKKTNKTTGRGEDKKTVAEWTYQVNYRIPIVYQILDGERQMMVEKIFSGYDQHYQGSFGKSGSQAGLKRQWEDGGQAALDKFIKDKFSGLMKNLQAHLKSQYTTQTFQRNINLLTLKKAEKIGQEDFVTATSEMQQLITAVTVENPLTAEALADQIAVFQATLDEMDPTDKKQAVAFQAAAHNLALTYALTGQYEEASAALARYSEVNKRASYAQGLGRMIADNAHRAEVNASVPMTFSNTYNEAADQAARAKLAQTVADTSASTASTEVLPVIGAVSVSGEEDEITGVISFHFTTPRDSDEAIKFDGLTVEDKASGQSSRRIDKESVAYVKMEDGRYLIPVFVSLGPIGMYTLQEVLASTNNLMLSQMFGEGEMDEYYALSHIKKNKKGKDVLKVYSIDERFLLLNINNFFAKRFTDCPTIVAKATAEEYNESEESLRRLVDDFAACNDTTVTTPE